MNPKLQHLLAACALAGAAASAFMPSAGFGQSPPTLRIETETPGLPAMLVPAVQSARAAARRSARTMTFDGEMGLSAGAAGAQADKRRETIEIQSWSLGASNPTTACKGSGGAGMMTLKIKPWITRKASDKPRIAVLEVTDGQGGPLEVILQDVTLSPTAAASGGRPTETISLNYEKISWTHADCGASPAVRK